MSTQTMKQGLRQSIIAARQKLAAAERVEYSREITLRLLNLAAYKEAVSVLGYMSFGAEFSTGLFVQQALQDGKQVLLPKVDRGTRQLELFRIRDLLQDVAPGLWDIPEPLPDRCERMDVAERLDLILLPGVAFARDGSRLGYGGGFYDKLLERISLNAASALTVQPALVAAAYSMQLVNDIPQEATDRKVEWLVTENEVIDCAASMS
ncbi:MAG: 5-formyltetrahydrofolate cyclo-ligase [Gallionellaceae bacterium]|jgi:5-formyltetrahydrofolate cyclo-ligase